MKNHSRENLFFTTLPQPPLLSTAQLRDIEKRFKDLPLMARAGAAAAEYVANRFPEANSGNASIVILCGPGNNGGDSFVAARHLMSEGYTVYVIAPVTDRFPADAQQAYQAFLHADGKCYEASPSITSNYAFPTRPALIIDALFGIGLTRAPSAPFSEWVEWANEQSSRHGIPILSLDIASGLESDTGVAHEPSIIATDTLTFIAYKPGLLTLDGADHSGNILVDLLGLPNEEIASNDAHILDHQSLNILFPHSLLRSKKNTHKGSYGTLGIIGGASGMSGAVILSGRAALHLGAGKVRVGFIADDHPAFDPLYPELMFHYAEALLTQQHDALVVGCGLGISTAAQKLLQRLININIPLVLDADALNIIAQCPELVEPIARRNAPTILTPHPAEAARLLQCKPSDIQHDRITATRTIAQRFNAHTLLKGFGSIIAAPNGAYAINTTGNPALAFGGSGDVLAGMIGALLMQSPSTETALQFAVCLHGSAADVWAQAHGRVGCNSAALLATVDKLIHEIAVRHER